MRDAHARGRLGDAVQVDERRSLIRLAVGDADDQRRRDGVPAILLEELVKRRLAQPRDEDRFVVLDQPKIQEAPLEVEHHQHVDRCSREARKRRQRLGLEDVADLRPAGIEQRPDALLVDRLAEGQRRHDQPRQGCLFEDLTGRRQGCRAHDHRQGDPADAYDPAADPVHRDSLWRAQRFRHATKVAERCRGNVLWPTKIEPASTTFVQFRDSPVAGILLSSDPARRPCQLGYGCGTQRAFGEIPAFEPKVLLTPLGASAAVRGQLPGAPACLQASADGGLSRT